MAEGLTRRGIDVTTSQDAHLLGAKDDEHLVFDRREQRVLVTRDPDFLRLHATGTQHCGIIFWTERQRSLGQLIGALDALTLDIASGDLQNTVLYM